MSSTMQRKEEKVFHVLKNGSTDAGGPFSKQELEEMLSKGSIEADDYVFFPGQTEWKLIGDVFEFQKGPTDLIEEGQNLDSVTESFRIISDQERTDEIIQFIAIQKLAPSDRLSEILQDMPLSLVLTNQRIAVISPVLIGDSKVVNYPMDKITLLSSQKNRRDGAILLNIEMSTGTTVDIPGIPEKQIFKLIEAAREFLI